ncbi:MAG: hypothetical protein AAF411_02185 [Myxococcota bacterium]
MTQTIIAALLLTLPQLALAQDPEPVEHEFTDADQIEGGRYSTDDSIRAYRGRFRLGSLIRPRLTFVPELTKSVENQ